MKLRYLILCLATLSLLLVAACEGDTPTESTTQGEHSGEVTESQEPMVNHEAIKQEYNEQLANMKEKLDDMKAQMAEASEDVAAEYDEQVQNLEESIDALQAKMDELGESAEDSWESLKADVDTQLNEVGESLNELEANIENDLNS